MEIALYENAMQVAPVLLIALFLDNQASAANPDLLQGMRPVWVSWMRAQNSIIATLNVVTFTLSMLVVAGTLDDGVVLRSIVLCSLGASISLLGVLVQQRLTRPASGK